MNKISLVEYAILIGGYLDRMYEPISEVDRKIFKWLDDNMFNYYISNTDYQVVAETFAKTFNLKLREDQVN